MPNECMRSSLLLLPKRFSNAPPNMWSLSVCLFNVIHAQYFSSNKFSYCFTIGAVIESDRAVLITKVSLHTQFIPIFCKVVAQKTQKNVVNRILNCQRLFVVWKNRAQHCHHILLPLTNLHQFMCRGVILIENHFDLITLLFFCV